MQKTRKAISLPPLSEYRYWPKNKVIPKGWRYFGPLSGNHARYSCLIVKVSG